MSKFSTFAIVACLILLIIAIFVAPMVDLQPTALRAQQWLILLVSVFALSLQLVIGFFEFCDTADIKERDIPSQLPIPPADRVCCLLC